MRAPLFTVILPQSGYHVAKRQSDLLIQCAPAGAFGANRGAPDGRGAFGAKGGGGMAPMAPPGYATEKGINRVKYDTR